MSVVGVIREAISNLNKVNVARSDNDSGRAVTLPLASRQQTEPSISVYRAITSILDTVKPNYDKKHLLLIEYLSLYNPDFSQAVFNVVNLANTNFTIAFDASVSKLQAKQMKASIEDNQSNWYERSAGVNGLRNDLFSQIAKYGALCAEKVPTKKLDGIAEVVLPPFTSIEFYYDKTEKEYIPVQVIGEKRIPLNEKTFSYNTVIKYNDKPYPIPPFLAALSSVVIEDDMSSNLGSIVKRFGLLGFAEMLLKQPSVMSFDGVRKLTEAEYNAKAQNLINDALAKLEVGVNRGYMAGFQDHHEFKFQSPANPSASGVDSLYRLNSENKINGLKQNPFMHGKNYSTTESLADVVLEIFILQIKNYQRLVDNFQAELYLMHLQLQGFKVKKVYVESDEPSVVDQSKKLDVQAKKIDNYDKLYTQGLVSQEQRALALGLEKPDQPEPRTQTSNVTVEPQGVEETTEKEAEGIDINKGTKTIESFKEFPYEHECGSSCGCGTSHGHFEGYPNRPLLNKHNSAYFKDADKVYKKTIDSFLSSFGDYLQGANRDITADDIAKKMEIVLAEEWANIYTPEQKKVIAKNITTSYNDFRRDKLTVFGTSPAAKDIPNAVFQQIDFAALDYFKSVDELYLGKFINDTGTKNKITRFLKDEYLEGGFTVGDKKSIDQFNKRFGNVLKGENWKIDMIVKTSVNNMRNVGSLSYMNQAEIQTFEIQGVADNLQCPYCAGMQGKSFEVSTSMNRVDKWLKTSPESLDKNSPFLTGIVDSKGLSDEQITEKVKNMSSKDIQLAGAEMPPFHPRCRDVIVAVL